MSVPSSWHILGRVCVCPQLASATRLFSKMLGSLGLPWSDAEKCKAALLTGEKQASQRSLDEGVSPQGPKGYTSVSTSLHGPWKVREPTRVPGFPHSEPF